MYWAPPVKLNAIEQMIVKRTKKARKLFVFLREHRREIISEVFEQKLIDTYQNGGKEPVIPGQLAMAILLQAYCNVSDKEAVELTVMDKRWQMVLNCLNCETPPFSQTSLVDFRKRLIAHDLDRELIDRSVEIAEKYGGFGPRQLKAALDSTPLLGAGRVEDTFNLLGHALLKSVKIASKELKKEVEVVLEESGLSLVGKSSIKAALDLDWGDPASKTIALNQILEELERWKEWLSEQSKISTKRSPMKEVMETIEQILEQDTEPDPDRGGGRKKLKKGVTKGRRISIEDKEMKHGRKSKSKKFNGFKQHLLTDIESKVIREIVIRPANEPEYFAINYFAKDLEKNLVKLHIDLGYVEHPKITQWERDGVEIVARPWRENDRGFFTKRDFKFDFENETIECPGGAYAKIVLGKNTYFPSSSCNECELRKQCTSAKSRGLRGRSMKLRQNEEIEEARRTKIKTVEGRAAIRERVTIEHRISHQVKSQGRKVRYIGTRKNQYDGRRHAVINNLHLALKYKDEKGKRSVA